MKFGKTLGVALLASAGAMAMAAPASAEVAFSGNVALTTDYLFRGVSQTDGAPAIQGGFDAAIGQFYVGTWACSVDFASVGSLEGNIEIDLYAGFKPTLGPVSTDFGVIGYFYPGASDILGTAELDYVEVYGKASLLAWTTNAPVEPLTVGAAVYYSPEFTGETGNAYYVEANAAFAATDKLGISGALGYQSIDDVAGPFGATDIEYSYTTWNIGATYSALGFSFDLRYTGTNIDTTDPILVQAFTTEDRVDDHVTFTVKRAL
jgi:uncharacterized protein (TIGR02001 family)